MKILIVEDEIELREVLADCLLDRNFIVFQVSNGKEALEFLENTSVDMVLSDVQMPIMDGMSFLKTFRAKYKKEPTIFIMSGGSRYSKDDFIRAGADGFFSKPIDIESLIFQKSS